jgi:hypothetical protein
VIDPCPGKGDGLLAGTETGTGVMGLSSRRRVAHKKAQKRGIGSDDPVVIEHFDSSSVADMESKSNANQATTGTGIPQDMNRQDVTAAFRGERSPHGLCSGRKARQQEPRERAALPG